MSGKRGEQVNCQSISGYSFILFLSLETILDFSLDCYNDREFIKRGIYHLNYLERVVLQRLYFL